MDFDKTFSLEQGLRKGNSIGFALVSAMEDSDAWRNHAKKCNVAKVISIGLNGERIHVHEFAQRKLVLDAKEWRNDLEQDARTFIESKPFVFHEDQEGSLASQNFVIRTGMGNKIYETQREHNLGCMCGASISVTPKDVSRFNDYGVSAVADTTSKKEETRRSGYVSTNFSTRKSYRV